MWPLQDQNDLGWIPRFAMQPVAAVIVLYSRFQGCYGARLLGVPRSPTTVLHMTSWLGAGLPTMLSPVELEQQPGPKQSGNQESQLYLYALLGTLPGRETVSTSSSCDKHSFPLVMSSQKSSGANPMPAWAWVVFGPG